MLNMQDQSMVFSTPKAQLAPSLMGYDYPYVNDVHDLYSPMGSQDFMSTPGLAFDMGSSPIHEIHTPSPHGRRQFVNPAQTFIDTFEPSTPIHSHLGFGHDSPSPYTSTGGLRYFISPVVQAKQEHHSPSPFHSTRSSAFSTPTRRDSNSFQALECSDMLHKVMDAGKVRKSSSKGRGLIGFVPEGKYKCTHPGCKSEHAFKRQEHLKRHMKTHVAQKDLQCAYCHKKFQQDRSDNYRSHVRLHAKKDHKGARTKYFAAAQEEVDTWDKTRSRTSALKELTA